MDPFANAERGRPEGAIVMERVSTMSTYISLDVCRTFARRQGRAGPVAAWVRPICCFCNAIVPDAAPRAGDELVTEELAEDAMYYVPSCLLSWIATMV